MGQEQGLQSVKGSQEGGRRLLAQSSQLVILKSQDADMLDGIQCLASDLKLSS